MFKICKGDTLHFYYTYQIIPHVPFKCFQECIRIHLAFEKYFLAYLQ